MRVRATQKGWLKGRREVGDEFDLSDPKAQFTETWMEPVDKDVPAPKAPAKPAAKKGDKDA